MADAPLDAYLAGVDERWAPLVRSLDRLILEAGPELRARVSYRMLMYVVGRDLRRWVVAIDVRPRVVSLRFLQGVRLHDPRGVLRAGTSTLMTLDLGASDELDPELVTGLVREAVEVHRSGSQPPADQERS